VPVVLAGVVIVGSLVLFTPGNDDDASQAPATQASEPAPADGAKTETTPTPTPPEPQVTKVEVRGGSPVGGVKGLTAKKGETVRLLVSSDSPQEVHLHGYDITRDAAPGKPARFEFKAEIEGVFEVELEGPHAQVAKVEVRPS